MKIDRIKPSFFSGRWYHLIKLRDTIQFAIIKYLRDQNDRVLLDFGCGDMPYYDLFKPYIKKYVCADIDRNPNAKLLINPDTGKIDAPDCTFDTILSTQVLEHVIYPKLYLQEAHRLLKKDGLLLLSTHGHWVYHPDPTDFWRWTRDGLEKTLTDEGFEIIETMGVGGQAVAGLQIFQDSLRKRFPGPFKKMWFGFIALVQLLIDGSSKHNKDACVYLVIARRSNS